MKCRDVLQACCDPFSSLQTGLSSERSVNNNVNRRHADLIPDTPRIAMNDDECGRRWVILSPLSHVKCKDRVQN